MLLISHSLFPCRAVQILPNRTILEVGQHSKELAVDRLSLTHDHEYIASCSHDSVKFWSVDAVIQARIKSDPMVLRETEDSSEDSEDEIRRKRKKRKGKTVNTKKQKTNDFFSDL